MTASASVPRLLATDPVLPPSVAPDGTVGRVLLEALRLFAQRGFYGTSIRDIADAAGLKSASLYAHFLSKDHILAELVRMGHEDHLRRLQSALLATPSDPSAQLAAAVRAHVGSHAEYPLLATVVNNELHALPADLAAPSVALRRQSEALLLEIVQRGIDSGDFDLDAPLMATAAIGGMGIRVANWYDPSLGVAPNEVADEYARFALRLVGARRS